jgi:hypothetical protein
MEELGFTIALSCLLHVTCSSFLTYPSLSYFVNSNWTKKRLANAIKGKTRPRTLGRLVRSRV